MPSLTQLLRSGRPEVRPDVMNVLAGLGEAGRARTVKALELKEVRPRAAAILARFGPAAKEAVPALIRTVQSDDPLTRHEALLALGAIGPAAKAAVPAAVKALQDLDPNVRYSACYALGKIGPPAMAAKAPLQQVLSRLRSVPLAGRRLGLGADRSRLHRHGAEIGAAVDPGAGRPGADDSPGGRHLVAMPGAAGQDRPPRR